MKCDGQEKHSHYQLATGMLMYHSHSHTVQGPEGFNRLHHHAPTEHADFTDEELAQDAVYIEIPF